MRRTPTLGYRTPAQISHSQCISEDFSTARVSSSPLPFPIRGIQRQEAGTEWGFLVPALGATVVQTFV